MGQHYPLGGKAVKVKLHDFAAATLTPPGIRNSNPRKPKRVFRRFEKVRANSRTNLRIRSSETTSSADSLFTFKKVTVELPCQALLQTEYRMVYQDGDHQLYCRLMAVGVLP
jgi:hypothetical protein